MANGIEHRRAYDTSIRLWTPPLVGASAVGLALDVPVLMAICVGFYVGLRVGRVVDPDLDHPAITLTERAAYNRSRLLGSIWRWYWSGYARSHVHRGVSHVPILGTWGRWWRLLLLPCALSAVVSSQIGDAALSAVILFWIAEFAGQSWQDLVHLHKDNWRLNL